MAGMPGDTPYSWLMELSPSFPTVAGGGNAGRRTIVQLTRGPSFTYPLYYFVPSMTADSRYLVYHDSDGQSVQLYRLDLTTGESTRLTDARCSDTQWHPWDGPSGTGVLDHRSALNTATGEVLYFDGNTVLAVHVESLRTRHLFDLPPDRLAIGQNCCSPDGRWFVYIHHDRELYRAIYGDAGAKRQGGYSYPRHLSRGTKLAAFDLRTGEHRTVVALNSPIHHVQPLGSELLAFSSLAVERAILVTDYGGGWYTHLRTQTEDGGTTCHYCATERGIFYEADRFEAPAQSEGDRDSGTKPREVGSKGLYAGVVDAHTKRRRECRLPDSIRGGSPHVGADPSGRRFLLECRHEDRGHVVVFLPRVADGAEAEPVYLFDDWPTYGEGQKSHFHPRVTADGSHLMIVAGDPDSKTNHIYLVDISDLPDTGGVAAV